MSAATAEQDVRFMRQALGLARRGWGRTSPNPMVGAVLVRRGQVLGQGWHRQAGRAHAEIDALLDAQRRGASVAGATLYVTLEPCSTHGRTPPCTKAIIQAGLRRVVVAAQDPNPKHEGRGLRLLQRAGLRVEQGLLAEEATRLNEAFNHWIVHHQPFVVVKAAMTLDGKIATATGQSKWITDAAARRHSMYQRRGADAIVVGIGPILADDPALTVRPAPAGGNRLRRFVLDSKARTPLHAQVVTDRWAEQLTTIVVGPDASPRRIAALSKQVQVWQAPARQGHLDLRWFLRKLGRADVTRLLVEGGGEVNASFLLSGLAHRVLFYYAPKLLGGTRSIPAVGGRGFHQLRNCPRLESVDWRRIGPDLVLSALVGGGVSGER